MARRLTLDEHRLRYGGVIEAYLAGDKVADIATQHGMSRRTVTVAVRRAGIPLRNRRSSPSAVALSPDDRRRRDDEIERLYRAGLPYKEIGQQLGVKKHHIANVVVIRQLPRRQTRPKRDYLTRVQSAERHALMRQMRASGMQTGEIAQALGVAPSTVSDVVRRGKGS